MQLTLFNIQIIKKDVVFIWHNTFYLNNTLWKDIFIAENKNPEGSNYVVKRTEHFDIDHQFPDTYPIIESFKYIT